MRGRYLDHSESVPWRQTLQDYRSKHVVHGTDEEFGGRFTGRYTRTSAIPSPKKWIYEHLRGRAELSIWLYDRGYQPTRGRSISSEDQGIPRTTLYRLSTDIRRTREDVRITMVKLIKEQRHFLKLSVLMTVAQRKALLQTITQRQIRSLSQIAHNIIKFRIKLSPTERALLKRERRLLYILGDRTLGYQRKIVALRGTQRFLYTLPKVALAYLESVLG